AARTLHDEPVAESGAREALGHLAARGVRDAEEQEAGLHRRTSVPIVGIDLAEAAGNQRRPAYHATCTSPISTGTSTSGPMTVANATPLPRPKLAMATAIASSKLFDAAVNDSVVARG